MKQYNAAQWIWTYIKKLQVQFVAVCETCLNKSSPDSLLDASSDYTVSPQDRVGKGGGTAFFIRKFENLIVHRVNVPDKFNFNESIVIDCRSFNSKDFCWRVFLIYCHISARRHQIEFFRIFTFLFSANLFIMVCYLRKNHLTVMLGNGCIQLQKLSHYFQSTLVYSKNALLCWCILLQ